MPDSKESPSKFSDWLSPHFVLAVLSLIVALSLAYGNLKSSIEQNAKDTSENTARIAALEIQRGELIELRADVKYIKEKIDKLP